jgi:hypothetical protein
VAMGRPPAFDMDQALDPYDGASVADLTEGP